MPQSFLPPRSASSYCDVLTILTQTSLEVTRKPNGLFRFLFYRNKIANAFFFKEKATHYKHNTK